MTTPTPRWTADLRVQYDRPETVAEMLDWLVDSDPIELRDLALNLLRDVETLKAELRKVGTSPRRGGSSGRRRVP